MDNQQQLTILDRKDLDSTTKHQMTRHHNLQHLQAQLLHNNIKTKNIGNTKRTERETETTRLHC